MGLEFILPFSDGIAVSEDDRVLLVGPGILWIKEATSDDSGSYMCSSEGITSEPANLTVIGNREIER